MLFCTNCGEEEDFYEDVEGTESFTERRILNSDGDVEDWADHETGGEEIDTFHGVKCSECGEDVEEYDDEELEEAKRVWKMENGEEPTPKRKPMRL